MSAITSSNNNNNNNDNTNTVPFACGTTAEGEKNDNVDMLSNLINNVSLGAKLHNLNFQMHQESRNRLVERFKTDATVPAGSVILMQGGCSETRHETDHEKLFRQESSFNYLFGVKEPDCYASIDVDSGKTTLYIPRLPEDYAIWMGEIKPPSFYLNHYQVDECLFVDELKDDLLKKAKLLYLSRGYNTDSGNYATPATFDGIDEFQSNTDNLYYDIVECRVIKSEKELELLRYINDIASDAHLEVMRRARPGMQEFQLESLFKHYCYFSGGCRMDAYTAIVGCGCNSATLHYGHAGAPNDFVIKDADMCLLDMGTEYHCYTSDITCSFPADGKFSADQKAIFEAVQAAQEHVMSAMKPGVNMMDMHILSYRVICEHLERIGILRNGNIDLYMEKNLAGYFMPHGLGHFLGLDTHDVGGIPKDLVDKRPKELGYKSLRCLRVLEKGMVLTVEPGVYFVDILMNKLLNNENDLLQYINPDVLKRFRGFGGVRLEDDVIITEDGCENMTNCPRTVEDVEKVMNGTITERGQLKKLFYRLSKY